MTVRKRFPRRAGVATLTARRALTPRMIRVTLESDGFRDGWPIEQPGEIITLLFAPPGEPIVLPLRGWTFPPGAPAQEWRNYTVRRHCAARGEIEVDVVLHEPAGPACVGAAAATTSHLADALRALPLPEGRGQAWGAAESGVARDLRRVLREERGLPRSLVSAKGYWLRAV